MFDREMMKMLAFAIGIGTEIVVATLLGFGAGYLLDKQVPELRGLSSMVLGVLGLGLGCYRAFTAYKKLDRGDSK